MRALGKPLLLPAVLLLALGALVACSPLSVLNALTPSGGYSKVVDLAYGRDPRQRLDVYTPRDLRGAAPVVVFFYGGSWNSGARAEYRFVGEALASKDLVAVIADYRLYPQVRYPAFLQDGAQALAWINREISGYGGDPAQLFVMGHSAGAYNAAMLALDPRLLAEVALQPSVMRGWIGLAGPYDFLPIKNKSVQPVFFYPDSPVDSQPINHVSAAAPPALLLAAEDDERVNPQRNTGGLASKLRAAGVPVQEQYFPRVSHTSLVATLALPLRRLAPVLDEIERFVRSDGGRRPLALVHDSHGPARP